MAEIQVMAGKQVTISSSVDAAANQRFRVYRRVGDDPTFVLLDTVSGGGSVEYGAWNAPSTYRIFCEGWWAYAHPVDWMPSREQISSSDGGSITTIRCEDYWSTDGDWNDLVVTVRQMAANPKNIMDVGGGGTNPYTASAQLR